MRSYDKIKLYSKQVSGDLRSHIKLKSIDRIKRIDIQDVMWSVLYLK